MIEGFVGFDKIRSEEQFKQLSEHAKEDRHGLFLPTHVLRKQLRGGEKKDVGYFSVGHPGAVLTFAWLSTKEMLARESFHIINGVEDMIQRGDGKIICMPVPKCSPFHPLMENMGYRNGGNYDFFIKDL